MTEADMLPEFSPATLLAARLTPRGRGAVAAIAAKGPCNVIDTAAPSVFRAANGRPLASQPLNRIVFGHWGKSTAAGNQSSPDAQQPEAGSFGEEVVVCRIAEQRTEIYCHGGDAAVDRILCDLAELGFQTTGWQNLEQASGSQVQVECLQALGEAGTLRAAEHLLQQQEGLLEQSLNQLRELAESAFLPAGKVASVTASQQLREQINSLLQWSTWGLRLVTGWQVVLGGRPNAGKSSLMNALLGFSRAIVSEQPGTTRDTIGHSTAFDGWPVQLHDTAGLRQTSDSLEAAGIQRAEALFSRADCRLLLLDRSTPLEPADLELLASWPDALVLATKCDLPAAWDGPLREAVAARNPLEVSAETGAGLAGLMSQIVRRLVPREPSPGTPFPVSTRQVALLQQAAEYLSATPVDAEHLWKCLRELAR